MDRLSSARDTSFHTQQDQTTIPSSRQLPVLAPATLLVKVTCEEVEELRDRLFKLTSDFQRLYGVFMPNGEVSFNAVRWNNIDVDLPFLFSVRERVVNLQMATKRVENGEEVENDRAFLASQRTFYNSLVGVVASAIEKLAWLRRELEGPNGHAYHYSSWYYQVIGNNPRSTDNSSAKGEGEEGPGQAGNYDGRLESPSIDSDYDGDERPEKRRKM